MPETLKSFKLFITFFIFFNFTCFAQKNITIPVGFVKTIPPKVWSDSWYKLNNSKNNCKVEIINSKLIIEKSKEIHECKLEIETGTFLGINNGEFGGQLTFIPKDKSKSEFKILRGNINFLFRFKDKIYFITGLAHMSYSAGALCELIPEGDKFTNKKILDFESAPQAFTIYNDKLLIAAEKSFYVIEEDLKKQEFFKDIFWEGLYPNSIAVANNESIFVGIRSGIVKLDLKKKELSFYKKI